MRVSDRWPWVNNNPFLPFNNPLVNNNPFNNPFAQPGFINPVVGFAPPVAVQQAGILVSKGPNTVNNATGIVIQPITSTTFADGTTVYRFPSTRSGNNIFAPYIW